jgi:hypothetical protein
MRVEVAAAGVAVAADMEVVVVVVAVVEAAVVAIGALPVVGTMAETRLLPTHQSHLRKQFTYADLCL